jgi:hypothetical protein
MEKCQMHLSIHGFYLPQEAFQPLPHNVYRGETQNNQQ